MNKNDDQLPTFEDLQIEYAYNNVLVITGKDMLKAALEYGRMRVEKHIFECVVIVSNQYSEWSFVSAYLENEFVAVLPLNRCAKLLVKRPLIIITHANHIYLEDILRFIFSKKPLNRVIIQFDEKPDDYVLVKIHQSANRSNVINVNFFKNDEEDELDLDSEDDSEFYDSDSEDEQSETIPQEEYSQRVMFNQPVQMGQFIDSTPLEFWGFTPFSEREDYSEAAFIPKNSEANLQMIKKYLLVKMQYEFWGEISDYTEVDAHENSIPNRTIRKSPVKKHKDATEASKIAKQIRPFLSGKIAGESIFDRTHKMIIKKGDPITLEIIEAVEREGQLVNLITNMTLPRLDV